MVKKTNDEVFDENFIKALKHPPSAGNKFGDNSVVLPPTGSGAQCGSTGVVRFNRTSAPALGSVFGRLPTVNLPTDCKLSLPDFTFHLKSSNDFGTILAGGFVMKRFRIIVLLRIVLLCSFAIFPSTLWGQIANPLRQLDERIPIKVTGGILFWGDVLFSNGWQIQRNAITGSYRLIDANSIQRAFGTFEECKNRLDAIQAEEGIQPMTGSIVIIMHGFGSNVLMTRNLGEWLRERRTHDFVFCMSYPSTSQSILEHAQTLERLINNLPPTINRIDFIGHSLGSIVIRRYLSGPLDEDWQVPENRMEHRQQFSPDPRIGRFVMLGPPNNGAVIASRLIGNDPIRRFLTGDSGNELGINWEEVEKTLGIPCVPFMIVAGGRGNNLGFSLLIPGDNDGVVSTQGTHLEGAEKWMLFNVGHNEMLLSPDVFNAIERFLLTGE